MLTQTADVRLRRVAHHHQCSVEEAAILIDRYRDRLIAESGAFAP